MSFTKPLCAVLQQQKFHLKTSYKLMCTKLPSSNETKPKNPAAAKTVTPKFTEYKSAATPRAPTQAVGPGATKTGDYKNTEYFCYNQMSYYDLEVEMKPDRMEQPSANNGTM